MPESEATTRAALDYFDRSRLVPSDLGADDIPAPIASALERCGVSGSGTQSQADTGGGSDKERASAIIESIGRDFVELRKTGRSPAWAELEDRLMTNAHVLIGAGMMSPKDWVGLAIDIEDFRKQEQGTQVLPADFIAQWLAEPEKEVADTSGAMRKRTASKRKAKKA